MRELAGSVVGHLRLAGSVIGTISSGDSGFFLGGCFGGWVYVGSSLVEIWAAFVNWGQVCSFFGRF